MGKAAASPLVLRIPGAFVRRADLTGASLRNANLARADATNAIFRNVNFENANLDGTILRGADLTGAKNLTAEQLAAAVIDETTVLPDYLKGKVALPPAAENADNPAE